MGWHFFLWTGQYLIGAFIAIAVSTYILFQNPKSKAYKSFFLYGLCTCLWEIFVFLHRNAPTAVESNFWLRMDGIFQNLLLPFILLTIIYLVKDELYYIFIIIPGLLLGVYIFIFANVEVTMTIYGWSYKNTQSYYFLAMLTFLAYVVSIIVVITIISRKYKLKSLRAKLSIILTAIMGFQVVGMFITNLFLLMNPNYPPFGGILSLLTFLTIAYGIHFRSDKMPDKIHAIKPSGNCFEAYSRFLKMFKRDIPGAELGEDDIRFMENIEAMGLKDIVSLDSDGNILLDSEKLTRENITEYVDTALRGLKLIPVTSRVMRSYLDVLKATYEEIKQEDQGEADRWLDSVIREHGGFLNSQGVLDEFYEFNEFNRAKDDVVKGLSMLSAALQSTADGIVIVNKQGEIEAVNHRFRELLNVPERVSAARSWNRMKEYIGGRLKNPADFRRTVGKAGRDPKAETKDLLRLKNGRILECVSLPQRILGKTVGRVWTFHDMTEQKRAEERIGRSLEEKEVMMQEIHHRVKNNLQVISSMFSLQKNQTEDDEIGAVLEDGINRVRTMALIHEKLYGSDDLGSINFGEYVKSLTDDLYHSTDTNISKVRRDININDVCLDLNTAIPLALIVNELVSNSLKYAFPEGREGKISIDFHTNDEYALTVSDTGVGLPEGLEVGKTKTLGLQLVTMLTRQVKGKLEVNRDKGVEFKITFPKPEED